LALHRKPAPNSEAIPVENRYAVYPEQIEVIPMSNLLKVTGNIAGELVVVEGHPPIVGWTMIMCEKPEVETGPQANQPVVCDMLRWAIGKSAAYVVRRSLNWVR
jgi:hypothetical protein